MTVYLGADHRGFAAKQDLLSWLSTAGYKVVDCGAETFDMEDDFPDYAFAVADAVAKDATARGVVLCGTGTGVMIAANKVPNVRCGFASSTEIVKSSREDDDINVLAASANTTQPEALHTMVDAFLKTEFKNEDRHLRRLQKIAARELGTKS